MTTATKATATATKDGLPSMITYLTRVLRTPTIGACWEDAGTDNSWWDTGKIDSRALQF